MHHHLGTVRRRITGFETQICTIFIQILYCLFESFLANVHVRYNIANVNIQTDVNSRQTCDDILCDRTSVCR